MNHHAHYMRPHRCGRMASRFLWFALGAGTATWWHCHKGYHEHLAHHCGRDRIPREAYQSPSALPPPLAAEGDDNHAPNPGSGDKTDRWGWGAWGRGSWPGQDTGNPHWDRWGWSRDRGAVAKPEGPWGSSIPGSTIPSEKVPEKDMVQQATDTITELSEATLNNLLVTVESLKAKLAEHRTQREQQERELQALREAKFRQFEEWQRQQDQHHKGKKDDSRRLV